MAENAHKFEKAVPCCSTVEEHSTLISLSEERRNLISVANKVFGEGKWSHTVVKQTKHFERYARNKCRVKCVSYIKIQLENGNCYEGDGFYIVEKSDEETDDDNGLRSQTLRIGSAVNALKRVLLSFGDKVERELKQLRRQIDSEQINTFTAAEPMDLAINFRDLISVANKVFGEGKWSHTVVRQKLDFYHDFYDVDNKDIYDDDVDSLVDSVIDREVEPVKINKYCSGCVSYVKIQLENGNFHEDIGYMNAGEGLTEGLLRQTVRIGSTVNALKRVLLSFGDKVERELKQLRRQIGSERVNTFTAEPMDLAINFHDLISVANKVFGEGKWSHSVIYQKLDFMYDMDTHDIDYAVDSDEVDSDKIYAQDKCRIGCVSFVKVQLENGNFHRDVGYFNAEELTRGSSICNARIGSAVNALKRVLLSFGDKMERELQQLQRQISSEQEPMNLAVDFPVLISVANKVFGESKWNYTVVRQYLDIYYIHWDNSEPDLTDQQYKRCSGCVSYVKIQLENENFHEDVGYYNSEKSMRSLSIQNARIGSAINALKRVLLSFGDKVERELQQLRGKTSFKQESTDLATSFLDLISAANTVFGEGRWNHTVVRQTLDFNVFDYDFEEVYGSKFHAGCVSSVKIQLENGNFHEDVGYFNAQGRTHLSIYKARIGSAVNALKRVLLSFGDKMERELNQLRRQISSDQEPMDVAVDFPDLISAANKVFGEGKWNHTVISQTLDFNYINPFSIVPHMYYTGCVSFVKVQLESGNFHEDVGYCITEEFTGLSTYDARIGSAVNALRRVLLSFGEKIEKQLQRQVIPKQISDIERNTTQSLEPMDLIAELPDLISAANKVFGEDNWRYTVVKQTLTKCSDIRGIIHVSECVSYVKVQLKNENFHMDIGYCITKESTRGLSILNAKICSAINALKRVLLSFGEKIEEELQRINPEQTKDVRRDAPVIGNC